MLVNDIEPFKADQMKLLNLFSFVLNDVDADKTIISTVLDELIKTITGTKSQGPNHRDKITGTKSQGQNYI